MDYYKIVVFITNKETFRLLPLKENSENLFKRLNSKLNISLYMLLYSLAVETPENRAAISEAEIAKLLNVDLKIIHQAVSFLKKEGHISSKKEPRCLILLQRASDEPNKFK